MNQRHRRFTNRPHQTFRTGLQTSSGDGFWDHEIPDNQIELAAGVNRFVDILAPCDMDDVELDEAQVKRVWIDPEFAKKHNLQK